MKHHASVVTHVALLLVVVVALSLPVVGAGETAVTLAPSDGTVSVDETTTIDLVVDDADGGVGAYTATVAVDDPGVATISDIEIHGDPREELATVDVAEDGSSADVTVATMDTDDTGAVAAATVTLRGASADETDVALQVAALGDESGESYDVAETRGATLDVEPGESAGESSTDTSGETTTAPGADSPGAAGIETAGFGVVGTVLAILALLLVARYVR